MQLLIDRVGTVRAVYAETIDLHALGEATIQRASHVEPDHAGCWWACLSPVHGPTLGPYTYRRDALAAELSWLEQHWLVRSSSV